MKADQLRELSIDELINQIEDLEEELFNLRMNNAVSKVDNPLRIRILRKDVARAKTILNEHRKGIHTLNQ